MKNGAQRDAIAKPLDAICYECETAGAMSSVPCLVRQMISQKLALLDDHSIKEATFDSYDERKNNQCLRGTRVDLLADIQDWSTSPHSKCIFWLNGIAGAGKSTISRSVAEQFNKAECLGASFFFKRGDGDRANAKKLFPTLARQLARHVPGVLGKLLKILEAEPDVPSKSLKEQFEKLIYQPLVSVQDNGAQTPVYVIVLDALDECNDASDIRTILRLIVLFNDLQKLKLRVFATSRPELPIQHEFQDMQDKIRRVVILHDIPQQIIAHDIEAFFRAEFEELVLTTRYSDRKPPDWPGDKTICKLVDMAVPLFIFASTVCRFVKDPTRNPEYQLQAILQQRHRNSKLDVTYRPVLKQMYLGRDKEGQRQWASDFRRVVGVIITVFEPLSIASLESLLRPDDFDIPRTLAALHSVLDISENTKRPIRLFHLSFRDYLIDPDQCPEAFLINEPALHVQIAAMCVELMTRHLRRDLCRLQKPGTMRSQVGQETSNNDTTIAFVDAYGINFWEASTGALRNKLDIKEKARRPTFSPDGKLFAVAKGVDKIELFDTVSGLPQSVLVGHGEYPRIIEFSPDSTVLASGSGGCTVDLWDMTTLSLSNYDILDTPKAFEITISPLSKLVTSRHTDSMKLWSTHTGRLELEGHTVAFNRDEDMVARGLYNHAIDLQNLETGAPLLMLDDQTVNLWDAGTGALCHKINCTGAILEVVFSPDGSMFHKVCEMSFSRQMACS
ncbi:WD40 repeat-like protein [Aureobasidium pullulans]|nr:WD40 repeat-like protein [Aureobasidium pullulans]